MTIESKVDLKPVFLVYVEKFVQMNILFHSK